MTGISAVSGIYIKDSASVDINIYSVNENYPCLGINTGRGEISIDGDGTKNINISCPFGADSRDLFQPSGKTVVCGISVRFRHR